MKKYIFFLLISAFTITACNNETAETTEETTTTSNTDEAAPTAGTDEESQKNVVGIAAGSKDHTTLVAAVKQAQLDDDLANAGPFTVFAPTNAAFDKVPKETLDHLMKDENRAELENILQYHVFVGVLRPEMLQDGQSLNQVNGDNVTIKKTGDKIQVNGANVVASIPASNGIIHVVDAVLLPPKK